ncbi:MAG: UDP-4-amino-4,6-dideoxy-N-acetyl-beta-L-altrosamine transaminase, partial [Bdellovibrionota bacterium]
MKADSTGPIPYGRQSIDDADIAAVVRALKSDWLTTGPLVAEFEREVSRISGAKFGVAVSSGTAGLHSAMFALGISAGDEVIVPSLTFAATANAVLYQGGLPIFADVTSESLLIDPADVEKRVTKKTKAIVAVDYAGNPCDYDSLRIIAEKHGLALVSDACHSLGGSYKGRLVGTLADLSVFSFHPVKHITTAEGGMIVTNNETYSGRMKLFRNHGITSDHRERAEKGTCHYEMTALGFNYRLTDIQCALGLSQLGKLGQWVTRRNEIAALYNKSFASLPFIKTLRTQTESINAHHLYVIQLNLEMLSFTRDQALLSLRDSGIHANVHYPPTHLHPYYKERVGTRHGMLPVTERICDRIISLPMFPGMSDQDVGRVIEAVSNL